MQTKGRSADKMQLKNGPQGRLAIEKRTGGVSEKKKKITKNTIIIQKRSYDWRKFGGAKK